MDKLGIEPMQLLLQAFNFVVLVVLLSKFLYKPILKVLEERKKKIAEGLAFTERAKLEEEKAEKKRQDIIDKAKEEAKKIVDEGKVAGKKIEAEITQKAHKQSLEILEKGKRDIELERQDMEKRLKNKTVEIAEAMVTHLLRDVLTEKNQIKII
ncbi:F0F1 ATP synthase subunit B [Candidatus Gottesmanbacteria bacterium]|nr:F0F1 ATP synthase subunit B [Candidatus Gottesmanbacteria bacterium]